MALTRVAPAGDSVTVGGRRVGGFGRVTALNASGPYYAGTIAELPSASRRPPTSIATASRTTRWRCVVTRASDGWVLFADTDGDGSLAGEKPVHDYLAGRETFGWAPRGLKPRVAVAVNFGEASRAPALDLVFDIIGHGTHVSGIAAGHDIYGVADSMAWRPVRSCSASRSPTARTAASRPPAACCARWTTRSDSRAERRLPLVLNMSFGVGNEIEGGARIDALVDRCSQAHPERRHGDLRGQRRPRTLVARLPRLGRRRHQRRRHAPVELPRCRGPTAPPSRPARLLQLARR